MVRLKDRYLLVNIVYTDLPPGQKGSVPDLLLYNQPTIGELRPQTILKGIRSQVNALFGDCGSGSVERSLQGKHTSLVHNDLHLIIVATRLTWFNSQVPFYCDLNLHSAYFASPLQACLGRFDFHGSPPSQGRQTLRLPCRQS